MKLVFVVAGVAAASVSMANEMQWTRIDNLNEDGYSFLAVAPTETPHSARNYDEARKALRSICSRYDYNVPGTIAVDWKSEPQQVWHFQDDGQKVLVQPYDISTNPSPYAVVRSVTCGKR